MRNPFKRKGPKLLTVELTGKLFSEPKVLSFTENGSLQISATIIDCDNGEDCDSGKEEIIVTLEVISID